MSTEKEKILKVVDILKCHTCNHSDDKKGWWVQDFVGTLHQTIKIAKDISLINSNQKMAIVKQLPFSVPNTDYLTDLIPLAKAT